MDKSKVNMLKVIQVLRSLYKRSLIRTDFEERIRIWDNIVYLLNIYEINEVLILMDDMVFNEYSIPLYEHYFQKGCPFDEPGCFNPDLPNGLGSSGFNTEAGILN